MTTTPAYVRIRPEARAMRDAGQTIQSIARHFGFDADTIQRAVDPEYAERRRRLNNEARRRRRGSGIALEIHRVEVSGVSREEAAAAIASVPADTRDLTARVLGDPLPGRSVLDKRSAQP